MLHSSIASRFMTIAILPYLVNSLGRQNFECPDGFYLNIFNSMFGNDHRMYSFGCTPLASGEVLYLYTILVIVCTLRFPFFYIFHSRLPKKNVNQVEYQLQIPTTCTCLAKTANTWLVCRLSKTVNNKCTYNYV